MMTILLVDLLAHTHAHIYGRSASIGILRPAARSRLLGMRMSRRATRAQEDWVTDWVSSEWVWVKSEHRNAMLLLLALYTLDFIAYFTMRASTTTTPTPRKQQLRLYSSSSSNHDVNDNEDQLAIAEYSAFELYSSYIQRHGSFPIRVCYYTGSRPWRYYILRGEIAIAGK